MRRICDGNHGGPPCGDPKCWQLPNPDERIDHPAHYGGDTTYEAIKVIEAWGLGFCLGNAVKYICRAGRKPGTGILEDLRKAKWYLDRQIEQIETKLQHASDGDR